MSIKKAVFPVAGLGTRFLPATKANPKEMLPVVDKPLIQYAVEEAIQAGITDLIFVTSSRKQAIEDHFDKNFELETRLEAKNKQKLLDITQSILPKGINCVYIRQPEPLGLGDAVLRARSLIGHEPFAVLLADDLFLCQGKNALQQLIEQYEKLHACVIAVEEVPKHAVEKYGIIKIAEQFQNYFRINSIVEKPKQQDAPSNFGVAGRYIFTARVFDFLAKISMDNSGEIQLTEAIANLIAEESVYALAFAGKRYDCGDKLGYLQATVEVALTHPDLKHQFKQYLNDLSANKKLILEES
ncbi:MAG: UTP--glucose-1-phosphate uridylyltransferase GalU [Pseudomonadota bacterium]